MAAIGRNDGNSSGGADGKSKPQTSKAGTGRGTASGKNGKGAKGGGKK
jgi:hypothetical protein